MTDREGIVRVRPKPCPTCKNNLNAIGSDDGSTGRGPMPGDPVVCLRCGSVMTVDSAGELTGFTDKQMDDLVADREFMNHVARLVRRVHFLRASVN